MGRSREEIVQDVYYKKFEIRYLKLLKANVPGKAVTKNMGKLLMNMSKNNPGNMLRITECLHEFRKIVEGAVLESESAYQMGYDSVVSGPNEINCHFSLFSTPEKTKEWEQGKRDAKSISG